MPITEAQKQKWIEVAFAQAGDKSQQPSESNIVIRPCGKIELIPSLIQRLKRRNINGYHPTVVTAALTKTQFNKLAHNIRR